MFKKFFSTLLIVITFFSLTPALQAAAHDYKDVPQGSPYYYPVDYLRRNNVFKDTEYFYPETIISKAEYIKYLVLLNSPEFKSSGPVTLPFEDIRNNAWYAPYFKEAIKLGILDDREKKVEPDKKLTLIDALTLLFHSQSIPIPNVYKGSIPYKDVSRNQAATPLIMRALSLDIIMPQRDDFVGIYQRVTRAQAARMIYKMDLVNLDSSRSNGSIQIGPKSPELEKIVSVWQMIENNYIKRDTLDKTAIADALLKNLVEQLDDPYSVYMNRSQNQNFLDNLNGKLEGIGAVIGFNDAKEVTIVSPIKGSPAEKAGILAKDVIVSVNDQNVAGKTLEDVVILIKGPKGTSVKIKIKRAGSLKEITVVRDIIEVSSVDHEILGSGDVMLIKLSQFNSDAAEKFQQAVDQLKSDSAIKGLIIDLRGDPGGLLDVAVKIVGHFVKPQDEAVTIQYADFTQVLLSRGPADLKGFPTVVLIDGGSASASEILAGALQDYGLATLVGEKSFGKGTVQEVNYFIDNSSLKLTVAKWLTPHHQSIQDGGIKPDVPIKDNETTEADEVLEKGLQELRKLIK